MAGYCLFDTAIGACGIAWGRSGARGIELPGPSRAATLARLARRFPRLRPAAPPAPVAAAIRAIAAALGGEPADLAAIELDLSGIGAFDASVYRAARAIPVGRTTTYGALAARLGDPAAARAVGQALGRNPWPIIVPCHRVTGADGRVGGFSAPGGRAAKLRLLEIEGALAPDRLPLFAGSAAAAQAGPSPAPLSPPARGS